MRTLRLCIFTVAFLASVAAQVFVPTAPNSKQVAAASGQTYVAADNTLLTFNQTSTSLNQTGTAEFTGSPTCLAISQRKAVIQVFIKLQDQDKTLVVIDLASNVATSLNLQVPATFDGSAGPIYSTESFNYGGCAVLPNGTFLLANSDNVSGTNGGLRGTLATLAIYDADNGNIQYYTGPSRMAIIKVFAIPGSTKCVVMYTDSNVSKPTYSVSIIDTANMAAAKDTNLTAIGSSSTEPTFSPDGKMYVGSIAITPDGTVTQTGFGATVSLAFDGDYTYVIGAGSNLYSILSLATKQSLQNALIDNGQHGLIKKLLVTRNEKTDRLTMLEDDRIAILDVARPAPAITSVVNSASFQAGAISQNEWITIFGSNLASQVAVPDPALHTASNPFDTTLGNTTVTIQVPGGKPVAMVSDYMGPNQLNLLTPTNLPAGVTATLVVTTNFSDGTSTSASTTAQTAVASPGFFTDGKGHVLTVHLDGKVNTTGYAGEILSAYGNGLGPVQTGAYGLQWTTTTPVVTVDGITANVTYSGMCPVFFGLYQVNFVIPDNTPTGDQPLTVDIAQAAQYTAKVLITDQGVQ